jgi:hypothetical protein
VRHRRSVVRTVGGTGDARRVIASDNQGCGDSFPMVERLPLGPCYGFPGVTAFCNDAVFSKTGSNFAALGPVIDQSNAGTLTGRGGLFSTSSAAQWF